MKAAIVLTTDFSELARTAYPTAVAMARRFDAKLILAHVFEPFPPFYYISMEGRGIDLPTDDFATEVRNRLDAERKRDEFRGIAIETRLLVDADPVNAVLSLAAQEGADLMCTASHGHTGWKHALLGSFAEKLVRRSPLPVLTVRGEQGAVRHLDEGLRILVPTDLSELASQVLPLAENLARRFKGTIVLLHVIEPELAEPLFWGESSGYPMTLESIDDIRSKVGARLDALKEGFPEGVDVEVEVREGISYTEISRFARESKADVVLIATHGRTGFPHLVLGSVAERVVRTAPCSVLSMRPVVDTAKSDARGANDAAKGSTDRPSVS
jgi:nucleotide-binding universal stress UspA family protein